MWMLIASFGLVEGGGSICPESMDRVGLLDLPASVVLGLKVVHTDGVRFLTNEENAFLTL